MKSISIRHRAGFLLSTVLVLIFLLAGCGGGEVPQGNCGGPPCPPGSRSQAPTLSVAAGDTENVLTVTPPAGVAAPTFNIYWSLSPDVTTATGTPIIARTSPFRHQGLTNGTPIFYVATIAGGTAPSVVAGGMPGKWTGLLKGSASVPPARDRHTAVYDSDSDRVIVFGGKDRSGTFQDRWVLTGAKGNPIWISPPNTGPPPNRAGHTAVYHDATNRMMVFGGASDPGGLFLMNDLWSRSNADETGSATWQLLPASGPSRRWGHAAVYDKDNDIMILFGGALTGATLFKDVWVLEGATQVSASWKQIATTGGPSARCCMAAGYDAAGRRMIIFGGSGFDQTGPVVLGDLWTLTFDIHFSTATWRQLAPFGGTPPSSRCCGVSFWDGSKLLLFGGGQFGNPSPDDKIHAVVLQSATFSTADGPGGGPLPRNFPTAVPAGIFLLFGGSTASTPLNDLWRLD